MIGRDRPPTIASEFTPKKGRPYGPLQHVISIINRSQPLNFSARFEWPRLHFCKMVRHESLHGRTIYMHDQSAMPKPCPKREFDQPERWYSHTSFETLILLVVMAEHLRNHLARPSSPPWLCNRGKIIASNMSKRRHFIRYP